MKDEEESNPTAPPIIPGLHRVSTSSSTYNPEDAIQVTMKHLRMEEAAVDAYQLIRESLNPVPTEKGVELMAQWQAIALNIKPKRLAREYMDLRFVNEIVVELGQK